MNPPIRLISTDFDGTLYSEFGFPHVPPMLQDQIARLQTEGAAWVINTGRDLSSLMETLGRCRLKIKPDFVVVVEREIYERSGSKLVELDDWNIECRQAHDKLFDAVATDLPQLIAWIQARFKATVYEDLYSPFCLVAESNEEADAICASMAEYCGSIPHLSLVRNDIYARLSHDSYNKGTALAEIAKRKAVPRESVFAAGDHYNDLPMLVSEFAGCLAAPENAIAAVKELVRSQGGFVSGFGQGHGVADALNFFLNTIPPANPPPAPGDPLPASSNAPSTPAEPGANSAAK
jgi:HAD superfamily hydrolase (TIGR01484 family)